MTYKEIAEERIALANQLEIANAEIRLLREQIRVADVAYQYLHQEHQALQAEHERASALLATEARWYFKAQKYFRKKQK